jgi:cytosine/adenosine deaminase-related metal-dependent hydrolase
MLGVDGLVADMFAEAQAAYFRSRDAGQPIDVLKYLANGQRFASAVFDVPMGPMRPGATADILVLDYRPPTPLSQENLSSHFVFGFGARLVESVMVDGIWRLRDRRPLSIDSAAAADQARETARALWSRVRRS